MDYYAATVSALALAITAKDDEKAGEATRLAEAFAAHIPDRLEVAKEEAVTLADSIGQFIGEAKDRSEDFRCQPETQCCYVYLGGCVYYLDNSTGEHLAAWWPEGGGEPMQCGNGGMDG